MSAGTGILHSEYNSSESEIVNLLQIWVFPDKKGYKPRYDQKSFDPKERNNRLQIIVSPNINEDSLWLNQDAYFSLCDLDEGRYINYQVHGKNNGVYIFTVDGNIKIDDEILNKRDAIGIWDTDGFEITAEKSSSIVLIEVPMS